MYVKEAKLLYIHIPKTGGTSISKFFIKHFNIKNNEGDFVPPSQSTANLTQGQRAHLTLKQYLELGVVPKEEYDDLVKFSVVRDPMERALSTFLYLKRNSLIEDSVDVKQFFEEWLIKQAMDPTAEFNYFLIPQYNFLEIDNNVSVDKILYFENLENDFKELANQLNIVAGLEKENVTGASEYESVIDARSNEKYQKIVKDIYKKDYEYFYSNVN